MKYYKREDFFSDNNTLASYWAGFIAADGCIYDNKLSIHLNKKDLILLESFKKDISYEGNVSFYKNTVKLDFRNGRLCSDLLRIYNITPSKSLTLLPPNIIDFEMIRSYIVGYIDGDGCIAKYNTRKTPVLYLVILGTEQLLKWISDFIFDNTLIVGKISKPSSVYKLTYTCSKAKTVCNFLIRDQSRFLERKWRFIDNC